MYARYTYCGICFKPYAGDACDLALDPDEDQFIVWGVGGLGETAFKHFIRANGNTCAHTQRYTCGVIYGYIVASVPGLPHKRLHYAWEERVM